MPDHPASIPAGVHVELSRARILPGKSQVADEWMDMLNARQDECVATLGRERMALEIAFRRTGEDGDWLYWVSIYGEGGEGLDESIPIDRDHVQFGRRCKEPGWEEAEPRFLLVTDEVRRAILAATTGDP